MQETSSDLTIRNRKTATRMIGPIMTKLLTLRRYPSSSEYFFLEKMKLLGIFNRARNILLLFNTDFGLKPLRTYNFESAVTTKLLYSPENDQLIYCSGSAFCFRPLIAISKQLPSSITLEENILLDTLTIPSPGKVIVSGIKESIHRVFYIVDIETSTYKKIEIGPVITCRLATLYALPTANEHVHFAVLDQRPKLIKFEAESKMVELFDVSQEKNDPFWYPTNFKEVRGDTVRFYAITHGLPRSSGTTVSIISQLIKNEAPEENFKEVFSTSSKTFVLLYDESDALVILNWKRGSGDGEVLKIVDGNAQRIKKIRTNSIEMIKPFYGEKDCIFWHRNCVWHFDSERLHCY